MTLGERLREERERLSMSQPAFAAIAGTTKQTLFSWESGRTAPDGFQLCAFAAAGVDVLFVITGSPAGASAPRLTAEEQTLVEYFRSATRDVQRMVLGALLGFTQAGASAGQHNSGAHAVQVGQAGGKVIVKKGGKP